MIGKVTLDYTEYAPPLSEDHVRLDLDRMALDYRSVDKIVLWEHQWDWIMKRYKRPIGTIEKLTLEPEGFRATFRPTPPGGSMWGIPVVVRSA